MKTKNAVFFLTILSVMFSACIEKNSEMTTTTVPNPATTATLTTATSISTAEIPTATITQEKSELEKCGEKESDPERDNCYLLIATTTGDESICSLIRANSAKSACIENTQVETDGKSTKVNGYVINKTTSVVMPSVKVKAVSKTTGEEEAITTTNSRGFYSMRIPSQDNYYIIAVLGGEEFSQELYAKKEYTHELWFKIQ